MNILLINKSDLLKEEVRKDWSKFFNEKKIDHVFFSAKEQQIEIDSDIKEDDQEDYLNFKNSHKVVKRGGLKKMLKSLVRLYRAKRADGIINEVPEEEEEDAKIEEGEIEQDDVAKTEEKEGEEPQMEEVEKKGEELVQMLKENKRKENPDLVTIGMVGFPNVGKSSVINVLCGKKLVGVASRPGKTRNFQTILLEKNLMLCDCPGLVFPSIAASKAQMVCNGVYPIDNLREYMEPIDYLVERIPRRVFEYTFKFSAASEDKHIEATRLLHCYANSRGYVKAASGLPNYHKAARIILKALVNGELIYCAVPDGVDEGQEYQYADIPDDFFAKSQLQNSKDNKGRVYKSAKEQTEELNQKFFVQEEEIFDVSQLDQDNVISLVTGKRVYGYKLNKNQRRELKWAIKRDEDSEFIFKMLDLFLNGGKKKMLHIQKREADKHL